MRAEISIVNLENNKVERFDLPLDMEEVELFLDGNQSECKITDVHDTHNLLKDLKGYNSTYTDINELVELIENCGNDIKETCIKVLFHYENNSDRTIKSIIDNFSEINDEYTVYSDYDNCERWAELKNEEYKFVDIDDTQKIYHNFNYELRELYLRNLTATVDIGEQLQEDIFDMNLSDMLDTVEDMGMLKVLDINGYLDWKQIVKNLRASGFYIDMVKDVVVVHYV